MPEMTKPQQSVLCLTASLVADEVTTSQWTASKDHINETTLAALVFVYLAEAALITGHQQKALVDMCDQTTIGKLRRPGFKTKQ